MNMMKIAATAAMALLLWGCFLTPGKFNASLDIRQDGTFTYRYTGEMFVVTPHGMMAFSPGQAALDDVFDPKTQRCWDEGNKKKRKKGGGGDLAGIPGEERDCTPEEIERMRVQWEEQRARQKAEQEAMKAALGGLDPSDPDNVAEFARRLERQQGWKRVTHKGNGLFEVEYALSGRLDRDFVFPLLPDFQFVVPFVQANARTDRTVRVTAPAFGQVGSGGGIGALMGGMGEGGAWGARAAVPRSEGLFTLTTDGEILTNNSVEGPAAGPGGAKVLKWTVGSIDTSTPEALLRL